MAEEYWDNPELDGRFAALGCTMSLQGRMAIVFLEKWGVVTGKIKDEEDSAGRAVLDVMPVEDVVKRAFDIAGQAVSELERRQWIRPLKVTPEQYGEALGRIESARYKRGFERTASR